MIQSKRIFFEKKRKKISILGTFHGLSNLIDLNYTNKH